MLTTTFFWYQLILVTTKRRRRRRKRRRSKESRFSNTKQQPKETVTNFYPRAEKSWLDEKCRPQRAPPSPLQLDLSNNHRIESRQWPSVFWPQYPKPWATVNRDRSERWRYIFILKKQEESIISTEADTPIDIQTEHYEKQNIWTRILPKHPIKIIVWRGKRKSKKKIKMQAALMLRSKQRASRLNKGKGEIPSNVATKEIPPYPPFPPVSWVWVSFYILIRLFKKKKTKPIHQILDFR